MKTKVKRLFIMFIYLFSLVIATGAIISTFINKEIYPESLSSLLIKLLALYSVPVSIIVGGIFGKLNVVERPGMSVAFGSAVILSVIWNGLIVWRSLLFSFSDVDASTSVFSYFDSVVPSTHFLIGVALSYYFASEG